MTWLTPDVAKYLLGFLAGVYTVGAALLISEVVHAWRTGEDRS